MALNTITNKDVSLLLCYLASLDIMVFYMSTAAGSPPMYRGAKGVCVLSSSRMHRTSRKQGDHLMAREALR
jgi:hypothetical protein